MNRIRCFLLALIALLPCCAPCYADDPTITVNNANQSFSINPTAPLTEATAKRMMGGGQLAVTITPYTTNVTTSAGSRFTVVMFSSDFVGTVQGCAYNGGAGFNDQFQALPPPGNYTIGPIAVTRTAGTFRILEMR